MARRTTAKNGNGKRAASHRSIKPSKASATSCDAVIAPAMRVRARPDVDSLPSHPRREGAPRARAAALGVRFRPSLESPYRWRDWGSPPELANGKVNKRASSFECAAERLVQFRQHGATAHLKGLQFAAKAKEIEDAVYDLKAVNPHKKPVVDTRTPEELIDIIEARAARSPEELAAARIWWRRGDDV